MRSIASRRRSARSQFALATAVAAATVALALVVTRAANSDHSAASADENVAGPVTDSPTPLATPTPGTLWPFVNDGTQAVRWLHVAYFSSYGGARVVQNAPGCDDSIVVATSFESTEFTWASACIDPGETVILGGCCEDYHSGYVAAEPPTFSDTQLLPKAANGAHVNTRRVYYREGGPDVGSNPVGCPVPTISMWDDNEGFDITWNAACVDHGETVGIHAMVDPQIEAPRFSWTYPGQSGCPIEPGLTPCPTLTPTPTRTPVTTGIPTTTPSATPSRPYGDANCDWAVTSTDALHVLWFGSRLVDSVPWAAEADVNGDGVVDAIDAALILQYVVGLIDALRK